MICLANPEGCIWVTGSLGFNPVGSLAGKTSLIRSSEDATSTLVPRERIRYKSGDTSIVEKKPLHDGSRLRRERKRTKRTRLLAEKYAQSREPLDTRVKHSKVCLLEVAIKRGGGGDNTYQYHARPRR
jgi:hypothetical protein